MMTPTKRSTTLTHTFRRLFGDNDSAKPDTPIIDFKELELKLMNMETVKNEPKTGTRDLHILAAAAKYGIPWWAVEPQHRLDAKRENFKTLYSYDATTPDTPVLELPLPETPTHCPTCMTYRGVDCEQHTKDYIRKKAIYRNT